MKEVFVPNHLHLLVRGYFGKPPKTEDQVNNFLLNLVERVRMKVVAGPSSVYVNERGNEGVTGTVTLATSHAAIHVWDANNPALFQFDIYSCCDFTVKEVVKCLDDHFKIIEGNYVFIDRNTDVFIEKGKGNLLGF